MITHAPTGWNTWDFRGFNRLAFLRKGRLEIEVLYAIWDDHVPPPTPDSKQLGRYADTFRWSDVTRLGPHAPLGLPASLDFAVDGVGYRAEAVSDPGGTLRLTVTPTGPSRHRILFVFAAPLGETPVITRRGSTFARWRVDFDGASWPRDYYVNIAEPYAVGEPGRPATIILSPPRPLNLPDGSAASYEAAAVGGAGALADAPQAMISAITWNTLYDTRRRLVSSPVSRDWCSDWRGVLVFCWDTFFVGQMLSCESPDLARLNFEAVTAAIDELGMVPNYYMAHGAVSKDRSMPPLGAYMIWKTQAARPDVPWLARMYPRLCRWHRYWMASRDGNGDGLLEWGTNPTPKYEFPQLLPYNPSLQHTAKCAMYESGLDNSPMYDDVPFNEKTHTLELADVGLNSYYAMDCEALAWIAEALGRSDDARRFRREHEQIKARINGQLWDDEHGIYANRHWDGRFSPRWSPTSFFPLIAGIPDRPRAERLIREHLLNHEEFWGTYVLPSISRKDPAFGDNDYWRGRIWGPFNFLVAEGLRRYRFDDEAAELARRGLEMFMANWRADGGVYENYNAVTGRGGDVWNAARLYHWGGLMVYIAIQELIDLEPAGYLRVGSLKFPDAAVRSVRLCGDLYDVELTDAGLTARRNGRPWIECDTRAIVRIPLAMGEPIEVSALAAGHLTIHQTPEAARKVRAGRQLIDGQETSSGTVYGWTAH